MELFVIVESEKLCVFLFVRVIVLKYFLGNFRHANF